MLDPAELKAQLNRTWPVFFARHGNFTAVQQRAMPPILSGQNTLVIAATAAGKTEAAIAPLLERHVLGDASAACPPELRILYICPTRALVRDLYERLAGPLRTLGVSLTMKSGDTGPVSLDQPPTVLITTPESTDSLLTRGPRILGALRAVVLDEIHLFDGGVRGDHLRCLLRRIDTVRRYASAEQGVACIPLQRVALSATVPDGAGVAERYLADPAGGLPAAVVAVDGNRRLHAHLASMAGLDDLVAALALHMGGRSALRKALVFCNTRAEVEQVAAYLRGHLRSQAAIFVHYSNLDPALRREVEEGFAAAPVALCVCTSTLELGIDIGSVDHVVLVGPPPTPTSFLQRMGRSGRRTGATRVLCLARSHRESVHFRALLALVQSPPDQPNLVSLLHPASHRFRPSVLVQQVFSILKQSPTGGVRLADLRRTLPEGALVEGGVGRVPVDTALRRVLDHLIMLGFLKRGRLGEWRAGPKLEELVDAFEIYSNIGADPLATVVVVDAYTGRVLAQTQRIRQEGETLLLGGRVMEVVWRDGYRAGVRPRDQMPVDEELRFVAAPFAVPLEVGQAVAAHLGLAPGQLALVHGEQGAWLFHFWGDVYGTLLGAVLQEHFEAEDEAALVMQRNEHCLHLPAAIDGLPAWHTALAQRHLRILLPRLEPFMELGRFHSLLPADLADQAVIDQCDLPRFEALYRSATVMTPTAGLRTRLLELL